MANKNAVYCDYNQLPLVLNANQLATVLGISRANAYALMHRDDFPTMQIGKRMMVAKDGLIAWMSNQCARKSDIYGFN